MVEFQSGASIVWFRRDLRLSDNPALQAALEYGKVYCLYIHAPEEEKPWLPGGATKWWLHRSLLELHRSLTELGTGLILRSGASSLEVLEGFAKERDVSKVFWNRLYDPKIVARDKKIKKVLLGSGLLVESFNGSLLTEPWEMKTGSGGTYKVYTPYSKSVFKAFECPKTILKPDLIPSDWTSQTEDFESKLEALDLHPKIDWHLGFEEMWRPGEEGGLQALDVFVSNSDRVYSEERDVPSVLGTSKLSPHLHFGEVSPWQVWRGITKSKIDSEEKFAYQRQIIWRDFAHSLLFNFPKTPKHPLREEYKNFPWKKSSKYLKAWQEGQTGYPIVDAGMRELWQTGWMHNRVRMVASSFLVKHLLQPWQEGAKWFWDTLVDADLANNTMGWQWVAGSGADAAPYFRVFNPVRQGERFDKQGQYVRLWVPELSELPDKWIHCPWDAPEEVLSAANIKLGVTYPKPIIDIQDGRERALEAYENFKAGL